MRVLQLYNNYQSGGGGETRVVQIIEKILTERGHVVQTELRDNTLIVSVFQKLRAAITGMYSLSAKKSIEDLLRQCQPDVVHIHNLYPLFSPSVLQACKEANVPVVMSVHNYALTCPAASHFREGHTCQRCLGAREYHCILGNCKKDLSTSAGYALRSVVARSYRQFSTGVALFLPVSEFVKTKMIEAGYDPAHIEVLENAVPLPEVSTDESAGKYVAYVGGMNVEKGVETLIAAARRLAKCSFLLAGDGPDLKRWAESAPRNCTFVGAQDRSGVEQIYRNARFVVVPSLWWEPFGLVAIEAMSYRRAVIAAKSGALPTLVQNGRDGRTFPAGDEDALTGAIDELWAHPDKCRTMGSKGRIKVEQYFSLDRYADRLLTIYHKVLDQSV